MKARLIFFLACLGLLIVAAAVRLPQWAGHAETAAAPEPAAAGTSAGGGLAARADATLAGLLSLVGLKDSGSSASPAIAGPDVTAVVRTGLGQLKWVATQATDYTPLQAKGRELFLASGCTYCHSLYSRPQEADVRPWGYISTDARRWGPEPEPGETAFDDPIVLGTKGIAPDLSRVGLKYGDEWHLAHFWQPPTVVPGSIMGGFTGLLFDSPPDPLAVAEDPEGDLTLERTSVTEALFDFASAERIKLTPSETGTLFVPERAKGKYPVIWAPNDEFTGNSVKLVVETENVRALTAFVQKLGMNRGRWRDVLEPVAVEGADEDMPRDDAMVARGQAGLRAALRRLPRRQGRRQRSGRDLPAHAAAAQLHLRHVQVPAHRGPAAVGRRSPADHLARRARHGDAALVRAAAGGSPRGDPVRQVRAHLRSQRPDLAL